MVDINPETQKTRRERMATVIALGASALFHLIVLLGGIQFYHWAEDEMERERLMVIRRIQETVPEPPPPAEPAPGRRPIPDAAIAEEGRESQAEESTIEERDLGELSKVTEEPVTPEEVTESSISVVTDIAEASFTIAGPSEFFGSGTFWVRRGAPPGSYTATFHPVQGFITPPIQKKDLAEKGSIAFVGKYRRSVLVEVTIPSAPEASFQIFAPDGSKLSMTAPGKAFFDDLAEGSYTIVFNDVPGYVTPGSSTSILGSDGSLSFSGRYRPAGGVDEASVGSFRPDPLGLDRRVQMVVVSYPATSIEDSYTGIEYPEIIIRQGDFQKGWCQVYLIVSTSADGIIDGIVIHRPQEERRKEFQPLIEAVERAVRGWEYDDLRAKVHVDVRFFVE